MVTKTGGIALPTRRQARVYKRSGERGRIAVHAQLEHRDDGPIEAALSVRGYTREVVLWVMTYVAMWSGLLTLALTYPHLAFVGGEGHTGVVWHYVAIGVVCGSCAFTPLLIAAKTAPRRRRGGPHRPRPESMARHRLKSSMFAVL